jgi:hypothetical protein
LYEVCLIVGVVSLLERVLVSASVQHRFGQAVELDYVGCYWVSIVIGVVGLRTMLLYH